MKSIPLWHLQLHIWILLLSPPCLVLSHDSTGPVTAVREKLVPPKLKRLSILYICHSICFSWTWVCIICFWESKFSVWTIPAEADLVSTPPIQKSYVGPCHFHWVLFMHLLLLRQIAWDHFIEKWNPANLIRTLASTSISKAKFQLDEVLPKPEPLICFPSTICDTRTCSAFLPLSEHSRQKQRGWTLMDSRDLNELDGDVILLWW